jgi:carboxylesterase type B
VQQLREMPLSDLVNNGPHHLFSPVVDGAELTDHPLTLFKNGQFAKVDVLLGFNSNEGFLTINELLKQKPGPITVERAREMLHAIVFRR